MTGSDLIPQTQASDGRPLHNVTSTANNEEDNDNNEEDNDGDDYPNSSTHNGIKKIKCRPLIIIGRVRGRTFLGPFFFRG